MQDQGRSVEYKKRFSSRVPEARYYYSNAVLGCNTDHKKKRLKFSTSFLYYK